MIEVFSPAGLEALKAQCTSETLYAFDFDGTLAPIVSSPADARLDQIVEELLIRLAHLAPTAVISGRGLKDLQQRVPEGPFLLVGNHGIENPGADAGTIHAFRDLIRKWRDELAPLENEGVLIENKEFSLSIHYRDTKAPHDSRDRILAATDRLIPSPRVVLGKFVVNIVPAGAAHKGTALLDLVLRTNCKKILFVGDDVTDEDIFALHDPRLMSIKIGEEPTRAPYFIHKQIEVSRLLEFAVDCLKSKR